jgi:hypothetical protein
MEYNGYWGKQMKGKWKWTITAGLCVIIFIGVYGIIFNANLENYQFNEKTQILTSEKGIEYHNLQEHFMDYAAIKPGKQIGKYGDSGSVYEIEGQEKHDWIYVDDGVEMGIQDVMIRKGMKPIPPEKLKPSKIEIIPNKGFQTSIGATKNPKVLKDIMATLHDGKEKYLKNETGVIDSLWLEDPRMKGIAYVQNILITDNHQHVYLSQVNKDHWREVTGPAKKWLLNTMLK